ncbi:UNVERIFIED_CONTAM: hypothetical protein GTU68_023075 [Idotea baltica]|nr:hypothetical protein [Idotea baltica]
MSNIGPLKES